MRDHQFYRFGSRNCGPLLRSTLVYLLSLLLFTACSGGLDSGSQKDSSKVTLSESLEEISATNAQSYTFSGKCDSSLESQVSITVGTPNITQLLDCLSDGTFSGTVDLRTVISNPATITAHQINPSPDAQADSHLDTITVVNKIVPLSLSVTPLPPPSIATHNISGTCDSNFGEVTIKVEEPTLNLSLNTSTTCVANSGPNPLTSPNPSPNTFSST